MHPLYKAVIALILVFTLLPTMIGIPFAVSEHDHIKSLQEHGIKALAQITDKTVGGQGAQKSYFISYRYQPEPSTGQNKLPVDQQVSVSASQYDALAVGQNVPIIYDSSEPDQSRLNIGHGVDRANPWQLLEILLLTTFIAIPVSAAACGWFLFRYRREKDLMLSGDAVPASIIEEREYSAGNGGRRLAKIRYAFTAAGGTRITASRRGVPLKTDRSKSAIRRRAAFFDNPTVVHDPRDARRHLLYPPETLRFH